MIYRIKEKFWSWVGKFTIYDDKDNEQFFVVGKAFSWGKKLSFQNAKGKELAFIEQKLMSWRPRYKILIDGKPFAEITKELRVSLVTICDHWLTEICSVKARD